MFQERLRGSCVIATGLLLLTLLSPAVGEDSKRGQHALLIGCTVYPNLSKQFHLAGPANDVELVRKMLVERFEFSNEDIRTLADAAGDPEMLPTRANIEREWRRLAKVARAGDQVMVMMAGHGTRAPQLSVDEDNSETDGLDEVFLPRDVGAWNDRIGEVENVIRDDDIRKWIAAISGNGASLWVVIDACHSGTMTRGTGDEVSREVLPEELGVPPGELDKAAKFAGEFETGHEEGTQLIDAPPQTRGALGATPESSGPSVVALYASQSVERTIEKRFPRRGRNRRYYGLLTYTLGEILSQSDSKLTYRELVTQIHRRYTSVGRSSPTPVLEGTGLDREVLGLKTFPKRSRITLEAGAAGSWKINAGELSGLTAGSILALYPPAGGQDADKLIGHVRIAEDGLQANEAAVVPYAYSDMPAPASLAIGMRGEIVFVDYGDLRLKIAVDSATEDGDFVSEEDLQHLQLILDGFAGENTHLVQAVDAGKADWLLRFDSAAAKKLNLVPVTGWSGHDEGFHLPPLFGPAPLGDELATWLGTSLTRIARAQALLRISSQGLERTDNIDLQVIRFQDETDRVGAPVVFGRGKVKLYDRDWIGFQVENTGDQPMDVTVLLVDSGYGIYPLFPASGEANRLYPGNKVLKRGTITNDTTGTEHLVVIAVKGKPVGQPANFAFLAQPTLARTRAASKDDPLRALYIGAMFGRQQVQTRGWDTPSADDYHLFTRAWRTVPATRPQSE